MRLLWEDGDISLRRELLPGSDQNYHGTFPWEFSLLPGDERSHDPFARRAGRVVVQVLDSDEEVSERESVWVLEQVTLDPTRVVSRTGHGTRRGFALPLYSEGMMGESEEQLRFLRAEIVPQLRRAKRMTIQGHCSNGENPWLESFRAGSVRDALMAIDSVGVASLEEVVVGPGGGWLFSQDSPDGRAHSRTVVVYLYY